MPSQSSIRESLLKNHRLVAGILILFILSGLAALIQGASSGKAGRVWQVYLINFLFWLGLSHAALVLAAVLEITHARWGRPFQRFAEAFGIFSPFSFLLFWPLYLGKESIFPWIANPVTEKAVWLNIPFFFARNGISLFLLSGVSTAFLYYSLKKGASRSVRTFLSPVLTILYCLVLSLAAFDLIMSLDPRWYSTLLGGYYFISSFYCGLAGVTFLSCFYLNHTGLQEDVNKQFRPELYHDLGKMLFGFCLMTGYLFYTQFLVIWYGNIPEESRYLIERFHHKPWDSLSWITLGLTFAIPFVVLLSRQIKMRHRPMMFLSALILAGMWMERFLLVAPSLWKGEEVPIGFSEVLITGGFLGLISLLVMEFLRRFAPIGLNLSHKEDPVEQERYV